jgi:hypothetical protein
LESIVGPAGKLLKPMKVEEVGWQGSGGGAGRGQVFIQYLHNPVSLIV